MDLPEPAAALKARWDREAEQRSRPRECLRCERPHIVWDGWSERTASVRAAEQVVHLCEVRARRGRCQNCRARWVERPVGLMPRRHYQPCVISYALGRRLLGGASETEVATEVGCSRRTVRRWVQWLGAMAVPAVLLSWLMRLVDAPVVPKRVEPDARRLRRAAIYHRATEVLVLVEALGSALGEPDVGLGAVLRRAVGHDASLISYADPAIPALSIPQDARRSAPGRDPPSLG